MKKRLSQRKIRGILLQLLYNEEVSQSAHEDLPHYFYELELAEDQKEYLRSIFWRVQREQMNLDREIEEYVARGGWHCSRLSIVDRNILRCAFAELREGVQDVPVVIHEAVMLAKRFGQEESARFVNGVLGAYVREVESGLPGKAPEGGKTPRGA